MSILCFGSANIDDTYRVPHMVARGETLAATSVVRCAGGKGLNQAIALARAASGRLDVAFAGCVGADGAFLLGELEAAGIDVTRVEVLEDERTGLAVIQNDDAGDNCIILYGGANRRVTPELVRRALAFYGPGDMVVLQNEVNLVDEVIDQAADRGMQVALNPSPFDASIMDLPLDKVDYLLVNEIEAMQLLKALSAASVGGADIGAGEATATAGADATAGDWAAVARALGERFRSTCIVMTLGAQGAYLIDGAACTHVPACPCKAVDTTAAGDTFTGYFLAGIALGGSALAAMATAACAASIAVSRPGAAASIPSADEVAAAGEGAADGAIVAGEGAADLIVVDGTAEQLV